MRKTLLLGNTLNEDLLTRVGEAVMQEVSPISDGRASAEYRREMSGVLARRALRECASPSWVQVMNSRGKEVRFGHRTYWL